MNEKMKLLKKLVNKWVKFLEKNGYHARELSKITISGRATRTYGYVRYTRNSADCSLMIADIAFADNDVLESTVAHEVIHMMIENNDKHGKTFKAMAKLINDTKKLKYKVQTYIPKEATKVIKEKSGKPIGRAYMYKLSCGCCGKSLFYKNYPLVAKNPARYRCGFCHGQDWRVEALS